jgi:hypothetical protein
MVANNRHVIIIMGSAAVLLAMRQASRPQACLAKFCIFALLYVEILPPTFWTGWQ